MFDLSRANKRAYPDADSCHKHTGNRTASHEESAQGTATDGLSITAMAYSNKWNSTDQVPLRAIASGVIPLYGELDPTDRGNTSRLSLSARVAQSDEAGSWKANAYVIRYTLDLYCAGPQLVRF
jgi:hypothetical protein